MLTKMYCYLSMYYLSEKGPAFTWKFTAYLEQHIPKHTCVMMMDNSGKL